MSVDCLQQSTHKSTTRLIALVFLLLPFQVPQFDLPFLSGFDFTVFISYTHTHTHFERCVYTYLLYMHCVTYFDALQRNQF